MKYIEFIIIVVILAIVAIIYLVISLVKNNKSINNDLMLKINDIKYVNDNKIYVEGTVQSGELNIGSKVKIIGSSGQIISATAVAIEIDGTKVYHANIGDNEKIILQESHENENFSMVIDDVFSLKIPGIVVVGKVESGNVSLNDEVQIIGDNDEIIATTVLDIEMFRKKLNYAQAGDNVGIMLKDLTKEDVEKGQVLTKSK